MEKNHRVEKQPYNKAVKALVHAAETNNLGKFRVLLQEIPDINIFCNKEHYIKFSVLGDVARSLCGADESNYCEFIQLLLEHGATVNEPTLPDEPIKYALWYNRQYSKVIDLYMTYGYKGREQFFHCAMIWRKEHCCRTFIEWGAYIANPKRDQQKSFILSESKMPTSYFYSAQHHSLLGLMCIMIDTNPRCLEEDWVKNWILERLQQNLIWSKEDPIHKFLQWVYKMRRIMRKHPASLQQLCRTKILHSLATSGNPELLHAKSQSNKLDWPRPQSYHPHIPSLITMLPLPSSLKEFLQIPTMEKAVIQIKDELGIDYIPAGSVR